MRNRRRVPGEIFLGHASFNARYISFFRSNSSSEPHDPGLFTVYTFAAYGPPLFGLARPTEPFKLINMKTLMPADVLISTSIRATRVPFISICFLVSFPVAKSLFVHRIEERRKRKKGKGLMLFTKGKLRRDPYFSSSLSLFQQYFRFGKEGVTLQGAPTFLASQYSRYYRCYYYSIEL